MPNFAPYPWTFYPGSTSEILDAEGNTLIIDEQYYPHISLSQEDWRRISAMPEMYEALKEVAEAFVLYSEDRGLIGMKVIAALAKADGK